MNSDLQAGHNLGCFQLARPDELPLAVALDDASVLD
jgi:hypothetical protein